MKLSSFNVTVYNWKKKENENKNRKSEKKMYILVDWNNNQEEKSRKIQKKKNSKNCFKILYIVLSHSLLSKELSILESSKKTTGWDIWQICDFGQSRYQTA